MRILLFVIPLALAVYAILDCARTPSEDMPGKLPKPLWLAMILLFGVIGPLAWIIISRVMRAEASGNGIEPTIWSSPNGQPLIKRPQRQSGQGPATPMAPDDDPEFLFRLERSIRRARKSAEDEPEPPETTPKPPVAEVPDFLDADALNELGPLDPFLEPTEPAEDEPGTSSATDDKSVPPEDDGDEGEAGTGQKP